VFSGDFNFNHSDFLPLISPSVLWRCWLGGRKVIRPVINRVVGWVASVVICLEWGADLHVAQLMPLSLTVSCYSKIQIGFTFLVPAHPGSPGKRAVKQVCVCVFLSLVMCHLFMYIHLLSDVYICVCIYLYCCRNCIINKWILLGMKTILRRWWKTWPKVAKTQKLKTLRSPTSARMFQYCINVSLNLLSFLCSHV